MLYRGGGGGGGGGGRINNRVVNDFANLKIKEISLGTHW